MALCCHQTSVVPVSVSDLTVSLADATDITSLATLLASPPVGGHTDPALLVPCSPVTCPAVVFSAVAQATRDSSVTDLTPTMLGHLQ